MADHPRTHRAREVMLALGRSMPSIWGAFDHLRQRHEYPRQIYVAERHIGEAYAKALAKDGGVEAMTRAARSDPLDTAMRASAAATLAAWRMTQGIYRIDPALYESLVNTELTGDIPAEALMRLPEWCVYIETPGVTAANRSGSSRFDVAGAWARVDIDGEKRMLIVALDLVLPDTAEPPVPQTHAIPLSGTLQEAIAAVRDEYAAAGMDSITAGTEWLEVVGAIEDYMRPIINLLLYIGHSIGDITGRYGAPGNPAPVRTRRNGWRIFPADGPRVWDVGVRMGAALRRAYAASETVAGGGQHASPRGHVRNAHWHGFRTGPRKRADGSEIPTSARPLDVRWLPPIPVNLGDVDDLPAVIRPVK